MEYAEALSYLADLTRFGINPGLDRIKELLRRLGNPQQFLKMVHIGGTNGKGSTAVMVANILQSAGYRVGLFTSPHLHSYCERFRINGKEIPENRVAGLIAELRPYLIKMVKEGFEHPTEFEVLTAVAFQYFHQEQVDFLVLEVGMGGAVDSTNVVTPLVSVITNVSLDHMNYLGGTVAEIAKIKCGIIKPGVPLVTAADGDALRIIEYTCREHGAPLIRVGHDLVWKRLAVAPTCQQFSVYSRAQAYEALCLPLLGEHQLINGATALAVAELLAERGVVLKDEDLRAGFVNTRWPCRLEVLARVPQVLLDGAHNHAAAKSLSRALAEHFPDKKIVLVLGVLADKERTKVVAELSRLAKAVIVTRPEHPRAGNWRDLAYFAKSYAPLVHLTENVTEALKKAFLIAGQDELICVTGSLYLVAEARAILLS